MPILADEEILEVFYIVESALQRDLSRRCLTFSDCLFDRGKPRSVDFLGYCAASRFSEAHIQKPT